MDFIHCNSQLYISVDVLHFLTFPGQANPTKHLSEHDHLEKVRILEVLFCIF